MCQSVSELSLVSTSLSLSLLLLSTSLLVLRCTYNLRLRKVNVHRKSLKPETDLSSLQTDCSFTDANSDCATLLQRQRTQNLPRCCCRGWLQLLAWLDLALLCFSTPIAMRTKLEKKPKSKTIQLESNSSRMQFKNTLLILLLCTASAD